MASKRQQLLLKIEQDGVEVQRALGSREHISVGQDPRNDVVVYGEHYPKKHVLFTGKNGHFLVNLKGFMKGEVVAGESRLNFRDMIVHDLLPRSGDSFSYPISDGKRGVVVVGDAKISFQCTKGAPQAARADQLKFSGFSWAAATFRDLGKDLPFKVILFFVVVLHTILLNYMNGLPDVKPEKQANRVPERLARIIVKSPEPPPEEAKVGAAASSAEEEAEPEPAEDLPERNREQNRRPESQGLLGLLTGSGSSGKSNNLADFLLDKGLAKDLDQVMSTTDLKVGKGNGQSNNYDDLISASEVAGGIDDILKDMNQVEKFSLGEKGKIEVDQISGMSGSESALGKRTEESVRSVLLANTGRLTYIYNKYLKSTPGLAGKMVVEVEIAADGSVASVNLVSSSMNHPEFEREVLSFVRRWKYETIDQGSVTVTYPLLFNKVG